MNPDMFFPTQGEPFPKLAKEACAACTVQHDCLTFAETTSQMFGMWGGKSYKQRRRDRARNTAA